VLKADAPKDSFDDALIWTTEKRNLLCLGTGGNDGEIVQKARMAMKELGW
jgi:hypothetical protein